VSHSLSAKVLTSLGDDIWRTKIEPSSIRRLGTPKAQEGKQSIVATLDNPIDRISGSLVLFDHKVIVLNLGTTEDVIVIKLGQTKEQRTPATTPSQHQSQTGGALQRGDAQFIVACRHHQLPSDMINAMEFVLKRVRAEFPGYLVEGQNRKWVNHPDNFVAITIQNKDLSFAIHVKGRTDQFGHTSLLLKADRPGYIRFKTNSASDVQKAGDIILRSARHSSRR
jgi:hypothetical protein